MLREILPTSQHPGEPLRRWFYSADFDLYVWQGEAGDILAFQLCYDKGRGEHALYWKRDKGFSHLRVRDGEGSGLSSETPILVADGVFDAAPVLSAFLAEADALPTTIRDFVASRIDSCSLG